MNNGIWRIIPSATITEIIAQSGFDFQILDCEHGMYDYFSLDNDIRACKLFNCNAFVRVSGLNSVEVQRCLDMGANGIVFPQLKNFEDCKKAVEMMHFPPNGTRGFNPFVSVSNFGYNLNNIAIKKFNPLCIIIIETLKAVEELDMILDLNIDMVYIGAYDLSAQLGCIGNMENENLFKVIKVIINKCKSKNIHVGMMSTNYNSFKKEGEIINYLVHLVESTLIKMSFTKHLQNFLLENG